MSYKPPAPRMPDAPAQSQYRCCVPDCPDIGVWSPLLHGSQWYCRFHARMPEPQPRKRLTPRETVELMARIWSPATVAPTLFDAERAAIQAEGER